VPHKISFEGSPYPNFVNLRTESNFKGSVLIHRTEFPLSALYNTDIIIIINLKVGIGIVLCTV
jgi:hypothetical protein